MPTLPTGERMEMNISRNLYHNKNDILHYFRNRSSESYGEIIRIHGVKDYKKRANAINKAIKKTTQKLKAILLQRSASQAWSQNEIINNILMVTYCSYIAMIEYRNRAWPYEYMAFSRRIGELWEPFCTNCFDFPVRDDIELYEPPLFSDVKEQLQQEIRQYITVNSSISFDSISPYIVTAEANYIKKKNEKKPNVRP